MPCDLGSAVASARAELTALTATYLCAGWHVHSPFERRVPAAADARAAPAPEMTGTSPSRASISLAVAVAADSTGSPSTCPAWSMAASEGICTHADRTTASAD